MICQVFRRISKIILKKPPIRQVKKDGIRQSKPVLSQDCATQICANYKIWRIDSSHPALEGEKPVTYYRVSAHLYNHQGNIIKLGLSSTEGKDSRNNFVCNFL